MPVTQRIGMAESRRRELIGAALSEISDRGSLDVTVAQIASRAGVSSALAHHYFGGKEDLILATMRHLMAEFGASVVGRLRRAHSPRARLTAIIEGSFGVEQFQHATISAWLTFYAKALSAPQAPGCSWSIAGGCTATCWMRWSAWCRGPRPSGWPKGWAL